MKVYVITTRFIDLVKRIDNSRQYDVTNEFSPDRGDFPDLYNNDGTLTNDYRHYYMFKDDNCAVIGIYHLQGVNNKIRVGEWKNLLKKLYNGDEYIFILHDKDYTDVSTSFQGFLEGEEESDTYIYYHTEDDVFINFLSNLSLNTTASEFDLKFLRLVKLTNIRNELTKYMKANETPYENFFEEIDKLLCTNYKQYDEGRIDRRVLVEIKSKLYALLTNVEKL